MVVFQQLFKLGLIGLTTMPNGFGLSGFLLRSGQDGVHRHHGGVAALGKQTVFIPYIGQATAHACGEVATRWAQDQYGAAGHVLATMVARAFHHGSGARQANRKALTCYATEKSLAAGGTIHDGIAHNDVGRGRPPKVDAGAHHHAAA